MSKFTLAMLLVLAAGEAAAAAAHVDFAYGNVTVSGPDGREQPLLRGAELDNGDTVRTAEGRAQLRFQDGAYVSLQPNSEFAIRDYRFDGKTDGTERGFFGLAKGAMRTVSGLIGHANRDRYRITTPTATIGIRGTGGVIQVLNDGSTRIVGTSGIWSLTNAAGSVEVPARTSALAPATPDVPPQRTSQAPQAGPEPLILPIAFAQGEQRDAGGNLTSIPAQSAAIPGHDALFLFGAANAVDVRFVPQSDVVGAFNSSGQLVRAELPPTGGLFPGLLQSDNGRHADFGTDGILTWGRWTGQVSVDGVVTAFSDNQGLHYVVGLPTPVLPTTGTATYALTGATRPTYVDGALGPGTFSGSLSVNFATANIDGTFSAAMPDRTYNWTASGTAASPGGFALNTQTQSGCTTSCAVSTQGIFAGPAAERIGLGYNVRDQGSNAQVIGTAAFSKQ